MSKSIQIEYCGESGCGAPALKLKKSVQEAFPGVMIENVEASEETNRIEVAWVDSGNKYVVWSNGKADTEKNHPKIVDGLKLGQ